MPHDQGSEIKPLTGVRGVAALWVAAYHLLLPAGFVGGLTARVLGRGYLAVDLFFMLSGFVMALRYGHLFRDKVDLAVFGRFIARRAGRLYPIYGAILMFRLVYTALRYRGFALPRPWIAMPMAHPAVDIPANLLMVQAWGLAESGIGPAWSISTEWGAYFAFPALAGLALWRGRWAAGGVFCGAMALVLATALADARSGYHAGVLDAWDGRTAGPLMRCIAGFTLGILCWRLSRSALWARVAGRAATCLLVACLLAASLMLGGPDLAIYPLFPVLILCLACGRHRLADVFACRAALRLGEISYSLYLLHIFLLHPLDVTRAAARLWLPVPAADFVAATAIGGLLLGASTISHRFIEQPGRKWMELVLTPR